MGDIVVARCSDCLEITGTVWREDFERMSDSDKESWKPKTPHQCESSKE